MKRCHDLTGLMKFATRPEWADDLNDALDDHLGPALTSSTSIPTSCPASSEITGP
jgi:hypothetical protein